MKQIQKDESDNNVDMFDTIFVILRTVVLTTSIIALIAIIIIMIFA